MHASIYAVVLYHRDVRYKRLHLDGHRPSWHNEITGAGVKKDSHLYRELEAVMRTRMAGIINEPR